MRQKLLPELRYTNSRRTYNEYKRFKKIYEKIPKGIKYAFAPIFISLMVKIKNLLKHGMNWINLKLHLKKNKKNSVR